MHPQLVCLHVDIAAAEIQLLRQALDKLQSETQVIDDELAKARKQAIASELERAGLKHQLETVTAQLRACEASKQQLESTISKVRGWPVVNCLPADCTCHHVNGNFSEANIATRQLQASTVQLYSTLGKVRTLLLVTEQIPCVWPRTAAKDCSGAS